MRAIAFALLLSTVAAAEDQAKPNALTAKEIADGWVLLFDGSTAFGWEGADDKSVVQATINSRTGKLSMLLPPGRTSRTEVTLQGANTLVADEAKSTKYSFGGSHDYSHSIKFLPSELAKIFNGKDLAGWKLFEGDAKRKASKYEVTKDGELKVSNGPGDLQTEKQYADFLLQFDCKTNGTALNSGIFFRCRPNEYQQGYEAQIQNAFKDNDRSKPTDFGTGAIYRRVPARKVVSNDNEWFTMTVLAVGPTIRTWVNGYPTVCWTDDRKPADNARNGLYTKAGHISIQGHDPTTDILFRNIRIVEIKP